MEALKDPDGASFSYMLPNTAIQWGPYCSDCMNSWHSDNFFPRDILIFPHIQGKSEAICLGDLELENGSTNPFKLKRSLSDLISLNCSKKECPNSDRFVVTRSKTMKHKNVETIRLKSKGRETQTDNREPSVQRIPPKTAPSTQPEQKEKKKEYPFLTGRRNHSDPISVTEENEAMMRLRQGINEEASILNKLLIKQGYQPTNCVPCGIPKNLSGPATVVSHVISDSHRTKIRGAGFEFSRSKDLKVLERLYEEAKSTKLKSNPRKQVAKQQKNSPSRQLLSQPAAAVAKTTVVVRVPNSLPSNLSNTSSPTLSASSGFSPRQVPPPIQADLPAHTMLKFSPRIQPKFAASKGEYILCGEGKDILVSNMNDSLCRGIMTRLCGMGGGPLRDFDKNGGCKAFEFWIDAFASAVDVRLDKSICWHGIKDDDGNYLRFKTLLYSPYRSRADSPPPVYYRPVYTPAKPQPNNEEGCTIS